MEKRIVINKETVGSMLLIALISGVLASCNSTQIDINSASAEELDNITGVGPAIASNIINSRPFNSLDDLINVSRIGNKTLDKIKEQGLACVKEKEQDSEEKQDNEETQINQTEETNIKNVTIKKTAETDEIIELPTILLNANSSDSKDIKSIDNKEILKRNLSLYGIIAFCVIFGFLFLFRRRKSKNEFK
jgi:competence ComEA-like helix-hairpin-helix protein